MSFDIYYLADSLTRFSICEQHVNKEHSHVVVLKLNSYKNEDTREEDDNRNTFQSAEAGLRKVLSGSGKNTFLVHYCSICNLGL